MTDNVIIGGVEYIIGGWGDYEIDRRNIEYMCSSEPVGKKYYGGLKYVYTDNVVRSIMSAKQLQSGNELKIAAEHLEMALGLMEDKLCDPDENGAWECAMVNDKLSSDTLTIPALTSSDVREFIETMNMENNIEYLEDLNEHITILADSLNADIVTIPNFQTKYDNSVIDPVSVSDDVAVLNMESNLRGYIADIEQFQILLASNIDIVASLIYQKFGKNMPQFADWMSKQQEFTGGKKTRAPKKHKSEAEPASEPGRELTRGEEIDIAGTIPPIDVIKKGLQWPDSIFHSAFNIINGEVIRADDNDGIYKGYSSIDLRARSTLLTPDILNDVAYRTSRRIHAWVVVESYEACYAIRAPLIDGNVIEFSKDTTINWIKQNLVGNPPHKMELNTYITYIRSLGFEIYMENVKDTEIRFGILSLDTDDERAKKLKQYRNMSYDDIMGLDWTIYDELVGSQSCNQSRELAGDIIIVDNKIQVPKTRVGIKWASSPFARSYITFHTHPSDRFGGSYSEPPSDGDISLVINFSYYNKMALHFIASPEGTYIIRPSQILLELYGFDANGIMDKINKLYIEFYHSLGGSSPKQQIIKTIVALQDMGLIIYFRDKPCMKLLDKPDGLSIINNMNRKQYKQKYELLLNVNPEILVNADWSNIIIENTAPAFINTNTWLSATIDDNKSPAGQPIKIISHGDAHNFGSPYDPNSYRRYAVGPLFVLYFSDDKQMPSSVPNVAITAAQQTVSCIWFIFLSQKRITLFRANENDTIIYGPVPLPLLNTE